jgi:hypothetical protein
MSRQWGRWAYAMLGAFNTLARYWPPTLTKTENGTPISGARIREIRGEEGKTDMRITYTDRAR